MKRNRVQFSGIVAAAVATALLITACVNPSDGTFVGGGSGDGAPAYTALIGAWGDPPQVTFLSGGTGFFFNPTPFNWTATATAITLTGTAGGEPFSITVNWAVSGGSLNLSNPEGTGDTVLAILAAIAQSPPMPRAPEGGFLGATLNLSGPVWLREWGWDDDDIVTYTQFNGNRTVIAATNWGAGGGSGGGPGGEGQPGGGVGGGGGGAPAAPGEPLESIGRTEAWFEIGGTPIGGSGEIIDGQLSFSIGTPSEFDRYLNAGNLFYGFGYEFSNIIISNPDARIALLSLITSGDGYVGHLDRWLLTITNAGGTYEGVFYIFFEQDVTVTGRGRTETREYLCECNSCRCEEWDGDCYCGSSPQTIITQDLSLNFRAGWNALLMRQEFLGVVDGVEVFSFSYSIRDPAHLRWEFSESQGTLNLDPASSRALSGGRGIPSLRQRQ